MDSVDEATPERLIEVLADAGEIDAGVEVLDALRVRDPSSAALIRLQARLFMAPAVTPEKARAAMAPWCNGALDRLARAGALIECAVGYRVLAKVFPDDRLWRDRHLRLETALSPLVNPYGDSARTTIDAMVARGATAEAAEALRALARLEPNDADLARRASILEELCAESTDTRAYDALTPDGAGAPRDNAMLVARVQRAVRSGDLRGALADATALSEHANANPRWVRFRSALQRLVAWSIAVTPTEDDEDATQRTRPIESADLWLRAGDLTQARDATRAQIARGDAPERTTTLSSRLADLDIVLDGTLPTPIPARPQTPIENAQPAMPAPMAPPRISVPEAPAFPPPVETQSIEPSADAQGNEDTAPARPPVTPPERKTPSQPPVAGDVKVGKRKIVRLS